MRRIAGVGSLVLLTRILFAQPSEIAPRFEIADVQASSQTATRFARMGPVRNGRYEIRTATMLDLIRFESIEKQLGLKLEAQKRILPVTVIDPRQQKPTDN